MEYGRPLRLRAAGTRHPVWGDGYAAALINFSYLARVMTTDEVIDAMKQGQQ